MQKSKDMAKVTAFLKEGNQLKKSGNHNLAIEKYTRALQLYPEYVPALNQIGEIYEVNAQDNEAISVYQKAIESSPNNPRSHWRLAELYSKKGDLDKAINSYQVAVRLKPDLPDVIYRNLAKVLKQQGRVKEAQALSRSLNKEKKDRIYLKLWKALNKVDFKDLDQNITQYPQEIDDKKVFPYFTRRSRYEIVNLGNLTKKQEKFLERVGLSLEYLKLNEAKVITSKGVQKEQYNQPLNFLELHLSMAQEGYIYAICPSTGKVLKSNRSLPLDNDRLGSCCYRFVGNEVFYLVLRRQGAFFKNYLYFPRLDLVILFDLGLPVDQSPQTISASLNFLKTYTVAFWQKFKSYLLASDSSKTAVVIHQTSIYHYIFNILPGIQKLCIDKYLPKIDEFLLIGSEFYGGIEELFPEISVDKIKRISSSNLIFKEILENNYFVFRAVYSYCKDKEDFMAKLIQRVLQISQEKCSSDYLATIADAKHQQFPLIWIGVRIHSRVWLSQEEGIVNIIKNLYSIFPNLGVVFDGFTRQDRKGELVANPQAETLIEEEKKLVSKIQSSLPQEIKTYNNIGCFMHESLMWAKTVDLCLEPYGSSITKTKLFHKPKVLHGASTSLKNQGLKNVIYAQEGSKKTGYDFDWIEAYEKLLKLASELKRD